MLLITGLPGIMKKEGWAVAARCMEGWCMLGPHALTPDENIGRTGMDRLDALATDILTMDSASAVSARWRTTLSPSGTRRRAASS